MHGQHGLPVARPQTKAPFGGFNLHLVPNGVFSVMVGKKHVAGSGDKSADQKPVMPTGTGSGRSEVAAAAPATDWAKRMKNTKVRYQPYDKPPPVMPLLTPTQIDLSDKNSRHVTRVLRAKL